MPNQQHEQENRTMKDKFIPMTSLTSGLFQEIAQGVYSCTIQIVNIAFIKTKHGFILIDAGMPHSKEEILSIIHENFGEGAKPEAIILTHGHFDHVGAIEDLLEIWNVPVYAHPLEFPYLTGKKDYPEPDRTVEGGIIAKISPFFPNNGINITSHLKPLSTDGTIGEMPGWKWIHTPGHTEGHISLFREEDLTLIAGDAFVTVRQDSLYKVLVQDLEVNGPPRYLTTDWKSAKESVKKLESLQPEVALTGHGLPVAGEDLHIGLKKLVDQFDQIAIPDYGEYVPDHKKLH